MRASSPRSSSKPRSMIGSAKGRGDESLLVAGPTWKPCSAADGLAGMWCRRGVAQSVEHWFPKPAVGGSSPSAPVGGLEGSFRPRPCLRSCPVDGSSWLGGEILSAKASEVLIESESWGRPAREPRAALVLLPGILEDNRKDSKARRSCKAKCPSRGRGWDRRPLSDRKWTGS